MKLMSFWSCVALALISFSAQAYAKGDFGFFRHDSVTASWNRPPDVLVEGRSVTVHCEGDQRMCGELQTRTERLLLKEFSVSRRGDFVIDFTITEYMPIRSGYKTEYQTQYWTAETGVTFIVEAKENSSNGKVIDPQRPVQVPFFMSITTSYNGKDVSHEPIPTNDQILATLMEKAAAIIVQRYSHVTADQSIALAMEDALHPGNELAKKGQYDDAIAAWRSAQADRRHPGDALYNIGAATEAKAYLAGDTQEAVALLNEAITYYDQAQKADNRENRFGEASKRAQMQIELISHYLRESAITARKKAECNAAEDQDSKEKASLRRDTRRALLQKKEALSDKEFLEIRPSETVCSTYSLTTFQCGCIVSQELDRFNKHLELLAAYRIRLRQYTTGGVLSVADRDSLREMAERMMLSSEETASVESEVKFRDLSVKATTSAPPTNANSTTGKPVTSKPTKPSTKPAPGRTASTSTSKPPASTSTGKTSEPAQSTQTGVKPN